MAPEQSLDSHAADTRADIYSLGCTLYYLLIGEVPYKGDSIFQVFMKHREERIPAIRDKRPDVPEKVERVFQKMLSKAVEDRYQSMGELLAGNEDCDIAVPAEIANPKTGQSSTPFAVSKSSDVEPTIEMAAEQSSKTAQPGFRVAIISSLAIFLLAAFAGYWWWNIAPNTSHQINGNSTQGIIPESDLRARKVPNSSPKSALQLDGNSDYVVFPTLRESEMESATLEIWLTPFEQIRNENTKTWIGNAAVHSAT